MAKARYNPVGENIDKVAAQIQIADALDVAAQLAIEARDYKSLMDLAQVWMEFSTHLGVFSEQESESEKVKIGFFGTVTSKEFSADERYEDEYDES